MNLHDYFLAQGSMTQTQLAVAVGATEASVTWWKQGKRAVPAIYAVAIEQATGGAVTRQDLRPDDWQRYWPELMEEGE